MDLNALDSEFSVAASNDAEARDATVEGPALSPGGYVFLVLGLASLIRRTFLTIHPLPFPLPLPLPLLLRIPPALAVSPAQPPPKRTPSFSGCLSKPGPIRGCTRPPAPRHSGQRQEPWRRLQLLRRHHSHQRQRLCHHQRQLRHARRLLSTTPLGRPSAWSSSCLRSRVRPRRRHTPTPGGAVWAAALAPAPPLAPAPAPAVVVARHPGPDLEACHRRLCSPPPRRRGPRRPADPAAPGSRSGRSLPGGPGRRRGLRGGLEAHPGL